MKRIIYKALWETTGWVDLYSPSCHFWAGDQPHSNILQMMLIKTHSVAEANWGVHCRILNRLSAEAYPGQSLMLWELSPGPLLLIILLLFKVLCFSGHTQSSCTVSLSCLSSPCTLSIFPHCVRQSCTLNILLSLSLPYIYSFSVKFRVTPQGSIHSLLFQEAFPVDTSASYNFILLIPVAKSYLILVRLVLFFPTRLSILGGWGPYLNTLIQQIYTLLGI